MKYKVTYTTGGGTEHSDGIWEVKKTPKTITATKDSELDGNVGVFAMHEVGKKYKIGANTGNPIRDHEDETFIVYFGQAGTPYYFEPIEDTTCKHCKDGCLACDSRFWKRTAYYQYSESELVPLENVVQLVNDFNFFDFEADYTPLDGRKRHGKFRKNELIFRKIV